MGYSCGDIIIALLVCVGAFVCGLSAGEARRDERNLKYDADIALAKCKSISGYYGGGKCFINGVELTTGN